MRRSARSSIALFAGTLAIAIASAAAITPDPTQHLTEAATLEAIAAALPGQFEQ